MRWLFDRFDTSDAALVRKARDGDKAAFAQIYDRHSEKVYNLLRRLSAGSKESDASAEDLTQETFLTAYQSVAAWRGEGKLSSWLCGIAVRKRRNSRRHNAPTVTFDESHETPDLQSDPLTLLTRREADAALEAAIANLPDICREAYVLTRVEGISYREAAALLEIPLGTLQSRLHRATRLLLVSLADFVDDAGGRGASSAAPTTTSRQITARPEPVTKGGDYAL